MCPDGARGQTGERNPAHNPIWEFKFGSEGETHRRNRQPNSLKDGGADRDRTCDTHNAIVVLYQLSYDPIQSDG